MPEHIQLIPHAQNTELRLQLGKQQTSFTLMPGRTIPPKTLGKIETWLLSQADAATAACLLEQIQRLPFSPANSAHHRQSKSDCTIVCDYSSQGNVSVWACVMGEGKGQVMCCGPVPEGEQGERYAILRTHHYLQRVGYTGTILSDEKGTVKALSRWYPVAHIDRSDARHRVVHHLAHNYALLLTGKTVTGVVAEPKALTARVWPQQHQADFIRLSGHGWKVALV